MTRRRFLFYVEADSEEDAHRLMSELLSLPRPITTPHGQVQIGMVDVTEQVHPQTAAAAT